MQGKREQKMRKHEFTIATLKSPMMHIEMNHGKKTLTTLVLTVERAVDSQPEGWNQSALQALFSGTCQARNSREPTGREKREGKGRALCRGAFVALPRASKRGYTQRFQAWAHGFRQRARGRRGEASQGGERDVERTGDSRERAGAFPSRCLRFVPLSRALNKCLAGAARVF